MHSICYSVVKNTFNHEPQWQIYGLIFKQKCIKLSSMSIEFIWNQMEFLFYANKFHIEF